MIEGRPDTAAEDAPFGEPRFRSSCPYMDLDTPRTGRVRHEALRERGSDVRLVVAQWYTSFGRTPCASWRVLYAIQEIVIGFGTTYRLCFGALYASRSGPTGPGSPNMSSSTSSKTTRHVLILDSSTLMWRVWW